MWGFDVYSSEIDDRGIDFVIRKDASTYFDIQVKATRGYNYIFMQKEKLNIAPNLFIAFVLLLENKPPTLYLIPSEIWKTPNKLFVGRNYGGEKISKPEWGLAISSRKMDLLEAFRFERIIKNLSD
jgi:hypothetical protein